MSDTLKDVIASVVFILTILPTILLPFSIGKDRGTYTIQAYIVRLVYSLLVLVLIGNVFGWW